MTMQRRQAIKTGAALSATLAAPWVHAQKADKVRLSWLPIPANRLASYLDFATENHQ